jgi:non-heme Fe2+,alpha-ketoglutarate-dependent halogenase
MVASLIDDYQSNGFAAPIEVMSPDDAGGYAGRLESLASRYADELAVHRYLRYDPHYVLPLADELMRHPAMLSIASSLLGADLMVSNTNFFLKEPSSTDFVSWHQDLHYVGFDGQDYLTVWLALTPATVENGCMRYLPGSHLHRLSHRDTFDPQNMLTRGQVVEPAVDEAHAVDVLLDAGQATVHHGQLCHASHPNRSAGRRIGFSVRYIAPHMRQVESPRDYGVLVSGEDRYGRFERPVPPSTDFAASALTQYESIMADRRRILYHGTDAAQAAAPRLPGLEAHSNQSV